jgi:Leucine-rich repeat (LRR) protein
MLIHSNRLSSLKIAGDYSGLEKLDEVIRVIDAHDNEIRELPAVLGKLTKLQVLNFENNKIAELPVEIGRLGALQTLNLKSMLPFESFRVVIFAFLFDHINCLLWVRTCLPP